MIEATGWRLGPIVPYPGTVPQPVPPDDLDRRRLAAQAILDRAHAEGQPASYADLLRAWCGDEGPPERPLPDIRV